MRQCLSTRSLASTLLILSLVRFSLSLHSHPADDTHQSEPGNVPPHALFKRFPEHQDLGRLNEYEEPENHTRLEKRGAIRVSYRTNVENADLYHAYQDMLYLVDYVQSRATQINPNIFDVYFHPFHATKVMKVAKTILQMAQPGGITSVPMDLQLYRPTDFSEIVLLREHGGVAPVLGEAFNYRSRALDPRIVIYDFGWQVLRNRRFLSDYPADCSKIGSKVDYRMQFLGGLILHEVL